MLEILSRGSVPKYKNIKSVAHNFGHSFLSDMNLAGTWPDIVMVPDVIYRTARALGEPLVHIDFFHATVEPAAVATDIVQQAVRDYARGLPKLLESQSVLPAMVRGAELTLRFDFDASRPARYVPGREVPSVECVVRLTDDRGVIHEGRPAHWCYQ
jgi:hypothetical protein